MWYPSDIAQVFHKVLFNTSEVMKFLVYIFLFTLYINGLCMLYVCTCPIKAYLLNSCLKYNKESDWLKSLEIRSGPNIFDNSY